MSSAIPLPDEPISYCRRFSLDEILSITNNFSDDLVIGKGGFGKVYGGFTDCGATAVAIKRLNSESKQGRAEFWSEIITLLQLRHMHIVTLIGFSDDKDEMILVYDYISNGTLAEHLYKSSRGEDGDRNHLTWDQRLNICIGAASGLTCLHENNIIHRDVKSTNILLNEYWIAKIADFGLSKRSHMQSHVSTDVKGTYGYLDPEYFYSRKLTVKSDVYAFGVVLLEVMFARPPVNTSFEELEQRSLVLWAQKCCKKGKLLDMIDTSLKEQVSPQGMKMFSKIANDCLHKDSRKRPTMAEVFRSLLLASDLENNASPHKGKVGVASLKNDCFRHFKMKEVQAATNNFDEDQIIGNGNFSKVYRGLIDGGTSKVSIKRWTQKISHQQINNIKMEMELQFKLHHLNLASLIGYYFYDHEVILVYEYMPNRSIHDHLYKIKINTLSWEKRLDICLTIARMLQYLRSKWPSVHRYLKLTNIFLDQNWNVKISGFQYITHNEAKEHESASSYGLLDARNRQYIDPEFYVTRSFSKQSDVYSFGVILLKLLCGTSKMIYSHTDTEGTAQVSLVKWFKRSIELGLENLTIDPYLSQPIARECFKTYVGIALDCVSSESISSPTWEVVITSLERAIQLQKTWQEQNHINNLLDRDSYTSMSIETRLEVLTKQFETEKGRNVIRR